MNHTPTPWILGPHVGTTGFSIYDGNGVERVIASVPLPHDRFGKAPTQSDYDERSANAAHIVRCVNAHDALVEALQDIDIRLSSLGGPTPDRCVEIIRAALAKVQS